MEPFHIQRDALSLRAFSVRRKAPRGFTPLEARPKGATGAKRALLLTGFTLIELLVVVAIMIVIMSIVLTSQSSFNKTLILSNTAYDVALSLRSAESFGLGSQAIAGVTNTGYGIDFRVGNSFTFFADTYPPTASASNCHGLPSGGVSAPNAQPGDCVYSVGLDQKVNNYALGNGMTISNFCAYSGTSWSCGLSSLDIVFARPNPTPSIRINGSASPAYTKACITISSPQGGSRFITVSSSGEINANAAPDPSSCS